ncbi:hypothetical protein [Cellulomonas soli]
MRTTMRAAQWSPTATVAAMAMTASTSSPSCPRRRSWTIAQACLAAITSAYTLTTQRLVVGCPATSRASPTAPTTSVASTNG